MDSCRPKGTACSEIPCIVTGLSGRGSSGQGSAFPTVPLGRAKQCNLDRVEQRHPLCASLPRPPQRRSPGTAWPGQAPVGADGWRGQRAPSGKWSQGLKMMTPQLRRRQRTGKLSRNDIPSPKRPEGGALGPRAVLVPRCDPRWPGDNQVSSRDRILCSREAGEIAQTL